MIHKIAGGHCCCQREGDRSVSPRVHGSGLRCHLGGTSLQLPKVFSLKVPVSVFLNSGSHSLLRPST